VKQREQRSLKRQTARLARRSAIRATRDRLEIAMNHHRDGELVLAEEQYRQILDEVPHHPTALHQLGLVAFQNGNSPAALELIGRAIAENPSDSTSRSNLSVVLRRMDRLEEALESSDRAVALDRDAVQPALERGRVLYALGRPVEALAVLQSVLKRDPENALAHLGIAFAYLIQGDFERGWAEFEYRWRYAGYAPYARAFTQPLWDGQEFSGRTILLHAEQGLGDTLQHVRFAPLVKALGGKVLLECQAALRSVLEGAPGVDQLFVQGQAIPSFDVHAPLMSMPWLLGTRLATIPRVSPYLPAAAERASRGNSPRLADDGRLRVGLVWAGGPAYENDHQRSTTLETFAPLGRVADVAYFSLQKGPPGDQATRPPPGLVLTDLGPNLNDFTDTAAVLDQLDLVISVDTAVVHLAGALGRPVWALLAFTPDFRWLLDRDDTPWYPSVRLFRQQRRHDWAGLIQDVSAALTIAAETHRASRLPTRTASATGIVAALPVDGSGGLAVFGRHIAAELSKRAHVRLVTDPFDADCAEIQRVTQPVLQAISNSTSFAAFRPDIRSTSLNVGYTSFEHNILSPEAIQHARRTYDHIVTGSTWCEEVLRAYGIETVSTILQGIDPLLFHPSPTSERQFGDRFVVFSGGKLEFRKGQDLVIRAFKVLQDRHKDVLLVNAWFNPSSPSLDTMSASPYINFQQTTPDHTEFVGQLLAANGIDLSGVVTLPARPNATMPAVYWDTDVGLFPNRCEGRTNLVLMEYMASGKPAIASFSSGHRDIVSDENALLIRQMAPLLMNDDDRQVALWDDPSLEETIERLEWAYQHPADLKPIGERAARDIGERTWTRTAAAFLGLLEPGSTPEPVAAVVTPKLSICIPTFNRCRYLENALTHLFDEQRFDFEFEVLISDNASTDGTWEFVERFMLSHRQVRYVRQTRNVGVDANLVAVYREARGEYTVYLADDDILLPEALGGVIEYLENHLNVGVCYCPLEVWDDVNDVLLGIGYPTGPEIVFRRDAALDLCNFVIEKHLFPEIFVFRSEILRKMIYTPRKAYWAFVNMINALNYADVAFLPAIFYRTITQHWEGEVREQAGIKQTMSEWDLYRGGLEYMLHRAFTYAGFAGVPPEQRVLTQQMVQNFVNIRMSVALRLLIQHRQYVSAYEVFVRLWARGALPESALAEYKPILVARASLEAFIQTFHSMTEMRMLGLFHIDGPQNVVGLIHELDAQVPVEILDQVDLGATVNKDRYLVLSGSGLHRQTLIDAGFPAGQVWAEGDLTRQFLIGD
jgi:glycosyltransferase involved in cell wall biosynthesis/tetratricopeptide (TPR) repeat protein